MAKAELVAMRIGSASRGLGGVTPKFSGKYPVMRIWRSISATATRALCWTLTRLSPVTWISRLRSYIARTAVRTMRKIAMLTIASTTEKPRSDTPR
jgi:hypothetical protein